MLNIFKKYYEIDTDNLMNYDLGCILHTHIQNMTKIKNKIISQKNKNNKTKPENLMKKEYLESYDELKKSIREDQHA